MRTINNSKHPRRRAREARRFSLIMSGDTLDTLIDGKLRLYQSRAGYRFSLDALLLAHFVTVKRCDRIVDLGAGNGPIALLLSHLHPSASLTGLEVQAEMAARAKRSVALNRLDDRVEIVSGDLREIGSILHGIGVPCRRQQSALSSGQQRPDQPRSGETYGRAMRSKPGWQIFLRAGAYLLRPKGRLALIYRSRFGRSTCSSACAAPVSSPNGCAGSIHSPRTGHC